MKKMVVSLLITLALSLLLRWAIAVRDTKLQIYNRQHVCLNDIEIFLVESFGWAKHYYPFICLFLFVLVLACICDPTSRKNEKTTSKQEVTPPEI